MGGTFGFDCLKAYNGDTVIFVGELGPNVVRAKTNEGWGDPFPPGGSSSSEAFQTELKDKWRMTERVPLPNWPPYNSHLTVWVRIQGTGTGIIPTNGTTPTPKLARRTSTIANLASE